MSILSLPPTKMDGATRPSGTVAPEARRNHPVVLVLVLVYALFLAGYGLNVGELYRNEGLRALVGAEASRTGNWLVPTLHGEPFLTKPPGMTVAIALCSWPGGHVSEWTARLPSVLAAVASILLFHRFFRRQFGWLAGLVAAAILPSSLFWLDRAPSAEIDMLQLAWVTAAMLCFLRGLEIAEIGGKGDWL